MLCFRILHWEGFSKQTLKGLRFGIVLPLEKKKKRAEQAATVQKFRYWFAPYSTFRSFFILFPLKKPIIVHTHVSPYALTCLFVPYWVLFKTTTHF